jgi:hypothetical protein
MFFCRINKILMQWWWRKKGYPEKTTDGPHRCTICGSVLKYKVIVYAA